MGESSGDHGHGMVKERGREGGRERERDAKLLKSLLSYCGWRRGSKRAREKERDVKLLKSLLSYGGGGGWGDRASETKKREMLSY